MSNKLLNLPIIGFKKESNPYQKEILTVSDYHYNINQDIEISNILESYAQKIHSGSYSKFESISGKRSRALKFSIDLYNTTNSSEPGFVDILECCGWYYGMIGDQLISRKYSSDHNRIPATIEVRYIEEELSSKQLTYTIYGAMGSLKISGKTGGPCNFEFNFLGCDDGVSTDNLRIIPSNFDDFLPKVLLNCTIFLFNEEYSIESFDIMCGNILSLFTNIQNICGYDGTRISDSYAIGKLILKESSDNTVSLYNKIINKKETDLKIINNSVSVGLTWINLGLSLPYSQIFMFTFAYLENGICLAGTGTFQQKALILRSTDYGLIWSSLGVQYNQYWIYSIIYLENGICLAGTGNTGLILRSTDYGLTWGSLGQQYGQIEARELFYLEKGICLCGTYSNGLILRSTDYGLTWSSLGQQYGQTYILTFAYLENGICLAGTGNTGLILRSTDYGLTWSSLGQQYSQTRIHGLSYIGNGVCLAGTYPNGLILRSTDYGLTWSSLGQQYSQTWILSTVYIGNGVCLAGTYPNGLILRSTDYGLTWSSLGQQYGQDRIWKIFHLEGDICFAGTYPNGLLLRSKVSDHFELTFKNVQLTALNDNLTEYEIEAHDSIYLQQSTS